MIAKLTGTIDEIKPTELILDVGGVGYHIHIPLITYDIIHGNKDDVTLHIFTFHREDQLKLYGFHSENLKDLFSILINISGIGPSMAISILSGISVERLVEAVKTEDSSYLVKVPGIGKSKAEKLIFELKRKIKRIEIFSEKTTEISSTGRDAVKALLSLGFDESKSTITVNQIIKENPGSSLETVVKEALRVISS